MSAKNEDANNENFEEYIRDPENFGKNDSEAIVFPNDDDEAESAEKGTLTVSNRSASEEAKKTKPKLVPKQESDDKKEKK